MTIESLISLLETKNFNVFLHEAPDDTVCPYVVLERIRHLNVGADNRVYVKTTSLRLRLVESEVHNWNLVSLLENTLDEANLFYSSDDVSDPSEHVCETHFELSFYGGTTNG